jgi:hypothetical protein
MKLALNRIEPIKKNNEALNGMTVWESHSVKFSKKMNY